MTYDSTVFERSKSSLTKRETAERFLVYQFLDSDVPGDADAAQITNVLSVKQGAITLESVSSETDIAAAGAVNNKWFFRKLSNTTPLLLVRLSAHESAVKGSVAVSTPIVIRFKYTGTIWKRPEEEGAALMNYQTLVSYIKTLPDTTARQPDVKNGLLAAEETVLKDRLLAHQMLGEQLLFRKARPVDVNIKISMTLTDPSFRNKAVTLVKDLVKSQCHIVGGVFDVPRFNKEVLELSEVDKCVVQRPLESLRLSDLAYFNPGVSDIRVVSDSAICRDCAKTRINFMALPPGYGLHPDAPIISSVSPVAGTNDRLEVFFTLAEYEGAGGSIDRVEVRFNDQTSHTDSPTNGSLTITGLTAGAKYEFRARSRNTNKLWSDESNLISGTVPLIGSPAPAQNESESECRFRYGRVGRVCNTVAKPQETADGVRLHMIHDLDLPTDMTAREFSSLDVPTFSDAVLLTTESDLFLARDGVEVVTGETPARQFGIACEGNEYARTLSYDFQTPALKDIFMSSPNNPILSRIRARVFDSGVNEGSLIFLRLDIKHGGTGPQLSSPISKWRIVFRFDDDDAKTFAVSIGDDITEPYFWRTADFSNFPAGMLAAFSRAQSAIKGGGAVESLKVALVDTTAWTNGSDWRKAFNKRQTMENSRRAGVEIDRWIGN